MSNVRRGLARLGALALLVASRPSLAQHTVRILSGSLGAAVDAHMQTLLDSGFSGAVVIARNDSVLLEAGYGLANRERRIPFTATTIAQVGSITKQFTATAVVDLVRLGRLHASDSIGMILPDVPAQARGLTVHMLLTHTAGLRDDCGRDFERVSKEDLIRRCLALPFAQEPGTKFLYSNLGYSVLGAVVEQVSGQPLETYLREHFFTPLHIENIGYAFPNVPNDSFATGYPKAGPPQARIDERIAMLHGDFWNLKGNGGMQASVASMYQWYRALERSPVITAEMRRALFSPQADWRPGVSYGYGWAIRTDSTGRTVQISHSGSDGTFVSLWYWRPVERVFIYTVTNFGESDMASRAVSEIVKVMQSVR